MPLDPSLSRIPGLGGYLAMRQMNDQQQAGQLGQAQTMLSMQGAFQQQEEKARQVGMDTAMRAELEALPPDQRTPENIVKIGAKYAPAKDLFNHAQGSIDRSEARADMLAQRAAQNEQLHEQRMARLQNDKDKAAETARYNRDKLDLQRMIFSLRQSNEPKSQIIQTENGPMQVDRSGNATPILGPDGEPVKAKSVERALPASAAQKLFENQQNLRRAETALTLIQGKKVGDVTGDADATGLKGFLPDTILQRWDPEGTDTRAALADLGSLVIHERSGAAVTAAEYPRLMPFIPKINDDPSTVEKKLKRFATIYRDISTETSNFYRESGYKVPELMGTNGAPSAAAPAAPAKADGVKGAVEKAGYPYEPEKYDYRVGIGGQVQRKPKK